MSHSRIYLHYLRDILEYTAKAINQPGGSLRDDLSIEACNKHGIPMVVTEVRHFRR